MRILVALTIAVGAAGCFSPTYVDPTCSPAGECPDGLMCGPDNICRAVPGDIDAAQLDAMIDAPDGMPGDANLSRCNTLDQSTCPGGWRCAPVMDAGGTIEPHCVPDGTIATGEFCEPWIIEELPTGYRHDDCRGGQLCVGNECRLFCDATNGPGACAAPYACVSYGILPDKPQLGVCDPTCDPVTQTRNTDSAAFCGSVNISQPERTCVGQPNGPFFCAPTQDVNSTHGTLIGQPVYLNACAAGFMPYMQDPGGTGNAICAAMCRPEATSAVNPTGAGGVFGSGYTCADRGANTAECRFVSMIQQPTQPGFGEHDEVGYCYDYANYPGMPSCTTQPDGDQANGCYPF
jgi:hypothetical protein